LAGGVWAEKKEGEVGGGGERWLGEPLGRQTQPPEAVERCERGRAVGAAAAQASSDRDVLLQVDLDAGSAAGLKQPRRAHHEVVVLGYSRDRPGESDPAVPARRETQPVAQIDQAESGLQQVVAVASPADHVQEQIQLRRGGIARPPGIYFDHWSTTRRISIPSRESRMRDGLSSRNSSYATLQPSWRISSPSPALPVTSAGRSGLARPCTQSDRPESGSRHPSACSVRVSASEARYSFLSPVSRLNLPLSRRMRAIVCPTGEVMSISSASFE